MKPIFLYKDNERSRQGIVFLLLGILTILLFISDLVFGSIQLSFRDIFFPQNTDTIHREILLNFRLPRALTAVFTGAALATAGLLMQTLFLNPLAGPYVLGVSSGASLGVALFVMATGFLPAGLVSSGWGTTGAAVIGALAVLFVVLGISFKIRESVSLLIIGMMFGSITGAFVSILQNYSNPDAIKLFIVWTFGSLSAVTWSQLQIMIPLLSVGLLLAFSLQKNLNSLLLGENYAKGLGISILRSRLFVILATGILAVASTAFTGPIGFIGIAVPHLARGIFQTSTTRLFYRLLLRAVHLSYCFVTLSLKSALMQFLSML